MKKDGWEEPSEGRMIVANDDPRQPAEPNPALRSLDRLVGAWDVSGPEMGGRVTFEWMEGGFFLVQRVDLVHGGSRVRGVEYIGYDGESRSLKSHYFGDSGRSSSTPTSSKATS